MNTRDEIPYIDQLYIDECWLEGERRGHYVSKDDPVIIDKVCDILLSGYALHLRMISGEECSFPKDKDY